jgi:NMD protein affecting ribosome stability and mRNA decay
MSSLVCYVCGSDEDVQYCPVCGVWLCYYCRTDPSRIPARFKAMLRKWF